MYRSATLRLKTLAKRVSAAAALVVASLLPTAAQESPRQQPEAATTTEGVDAVLDAYVQALGGRAALDRLKTRRTEGLIEIPNHDDLGSFLTSWEAPDHGWLEIAEPGVATRIVAFNGKSGWREGSTEWGTYELLSRRGVEDLLRMADPIRYANLKDIYPGVRREVEGSTEGRSSIVILRVITEGSVIRYLFDSNSHLLKEIEEHRNDELFARHYEFKNYRKVDGIQFPFVLHEIVPLPNLDPAAARIESIVRFRKVTHNVHIPAKLFEPDQGWKAVLEMHEDTGEGGDRAELELPSPASTLDNAVSAAATAPPVPPPPAVAVAEKPSIDDGVQEVLDAYVEALGGRDALDRLVTRRSQAIVEDLNYPVSRSLVISWEAPNHGSIELFEEGQTPSDHKHGRYFRLERTTAIVGSTGRPLLEGKYRRDSRCSYTCRSWLRYANLKSLYPDLTRESSIRRTAAPIVIRAAAGGSVFRFIFDSQTHLLTELQELTRGAEEPRRFEFEDYREVDGIRFPFAIHESFTIPGAPERTANQDKVIRFQKVQHNVEIPAQLCKPPAALLSTPELQPSQ